MPDMKPPARARFAVTLAALTLAAIPLGTLAPARHAQAAQGAAQGETLAVLHADQPGPLVDRHIFSQFAEHLGTGIYGGIWVGPGSPIPNDHGYRLDVLRALQALKIPALRWPGGCFADQYHWRDGIGPRAQRPVRLNLTWGGVEESNAFGTHEFMDLAERLGTDVYLAVNLGSATAQEARDWLEYLTSDSGSTLAQERRRNGRDKPWRVAYVGIGNESWGCGGSMSAEYYADVYRRYQTFTTTAGGPPPVKVASGPDGDDPAWTQTLMRKAGTLFDGLSLHQYTIPSGDWQHKGPSVDFPRAHYDRVIAGAYDMDRLIAAHAAVMDRADPARKVALMVDEWGIWTDPLPGTNPGFLHQQVSLRDALYAATVLNIFAHHADRVRMANIAQMVNVLQAMILTDGPRMVLTPTYHVFRLYQGFQDATLLPLDLTAPRYQAGETVVPAVNAAAVRGKDGVVRLALVNVDPEQGQDLAIGLQGVRADSVTGQVLTGPAVTAVNAFDTAPTVAPAPFTDARLEAGTLHVRLPARALVMLELH